MFLSRLAVLGMLAVSFPLYGAPWIGHGPVSAVTALAGHDSTIYAGTDGLGFFRSGDNGRTWTEINNSGTNQSSVYAMVIDPTGTVYANTNIGLLASRDRGSSWTTLSTSTYGLTVGLALDGSTLYAFGFGPPNLARTSDGGMTWEPASITGLNKDDDWVTGVAVHGNTLVASTAHGGLYRSSDHGKNWSRVSTTSGERVAVLSDGTFLAGTGSGVLRSIDDGQAWIESNSGLTDSARVSVWGIIPGTGATVYLNSNVGGSARSDDGGRTWTMINDGFVPAPPGIWAMALVGTTLYAAVQPGVYRRGDADGAWSVTAALPGKGSISSLAANAMTTWAIEEWHAWRSGDGGSTWITGNVDCVAIAADPNNGAIAYAATALPFQNPVHFRETISRTSDGGVTWTVLWTGALGTSFQALAVDPRSSQWLYAGLKNGLMNSRDGGATWSTALSGESVVAFAFDALTVYAATATGMFVSHDNGATWTRTLSGTVLAVANTTRFTYATTHTILFFTLDHGANWSPVANFPASISALASAPYDRLLVASAGDVLELRDNIYWTRRSESPAGSPITALLFRDDSLIAGTSTRGVLALALPLRIRAARPR